MSSGCSPQIPEEMVTQSRNSYMEAELLVPPLDELCKAHEEEMDEDEVEEDEDGSYQAHLERLVQNLLKEAKDKSKGWVSRSTTDHTELAFKKVHFYHCVIFNPCNVFRLLSTQSQLIKHS